MSSYNPVLWGWGYIAIMTYLNAASQSPFTPLAHTETHAAYVACVSPAVRAVISQLLLWLCAEVKPQRGSSLAIRSAKVMAIVSALAGIMVCLPGTFAEKKALLGSHFAALTARLDRIYKRYLAWRQRKCWMWGGGCLARPLTPVIGAFAKTRDCTDFAARIPD